MPLLILLLLLFFIPWIGFIFLLLMGVLLILSIPLGFASSSFFQTLANPAKIFSSIFNGRIKKNRALEHATLNVLRSKGYSVGSGDAFEGGFSVRAVDPELVYNGAREALERLKSGESSLALIDRSTLSIVVATTGLSLLFLITLVVLGDLSILTVLVSLVASHLIGTFLSPFVQRYILVNTDVKDLRVSGVELRSSSGKYLGAYVRIPDQVFISTLSESGVIEAEVV